MTPNYLQIFQKKAWFWKIASSPKKILYPKLQIFLHRHIRQIRDILQLCDLQCLTGSLTRVIGKCEASDSGWRQLGWPALCATAPAAHLEHWTLPTSSSSRASCWWLWWWCWHWWRQGGRQAGGREGAWGWQPSCTGADLEQSLLDTSCWRPPACHSPIGVSEMIIRVGFINDKVKFKRQHNPLNATIFPLQSFSDASNLVSISQLFAPLMTIITFQLSVCRHCNQHMAIGQSLHLTARISLTNTNDSNNQRQSYLKLFANWSSRYCIRHKSSLVILQQQPSVGACLMMCKQSSRHWVSMNGRSSHLVTSG